MSSDELTSDFRDYLAEIDEENEDLVQTNKLSFALLCKQLKFNLDSHSSSKVRETMNEMLSKHFDPSKPDQLISMTNPELRKECEGVLRQMATLGNLKESDKRLKVIWMANQVFGVYLYLGYVSTTLPYLP